MRTQVASTVSTIRRKCRIHCQQCQHRQREEYTESAEYTVNSVNTVNERNIQKVQNTLSTVSTPSTRGIYRKCRIQSCGSFEIRCGIHRRSSLGPRPSRDSFTNVSNVGIPFRKTGNPIRSLDLKLSCDKKVVPHGTRMRGRADRIMTTQIGTKSHDCQTIHVHMLTQEDTRPRLSEEVRQVQRLRNNHMTTRIPKSHSLCA